MSNIRKITFLYGKRSFAKENTAKLDVIDPMIVTVNETITEFLIPVHSESSFSNLEYASVVKGSGIHCGGRENTPALFLNDVDIIQIKGAIIIIDPNNSIIKIIVFVSFDSLLIFTPP